MVADIPRPGYAPPSGVIIYTLHISPSFFTGNKLLPKYYPAVISEKITIKNTINVCVKSEVQKSSDENVTQLVPRTTENDIRTKESNAVDVSPINPDDIEELHSDAALKSTKAPALEKSAAEPICPSIPETNDGNSEVPKSSDENVPQLVPRTTQNDIRTKESSAVDVSPINPDDIEGSHSDAALKSSHATAVEKLAAEPICPCIPETIDGNSEVPKSSDENIPQLVPRTTQNDIRTKESSAVDVSPINLDDIEGSHSDAALKSSHATAIEKSAAKPICPSIPETIGGNSEVPKSSDEKVPQLVPRTTQNDVRTKESSAVDVSPISRDDIEGSLSDPAFKSSHATAIEKSAAESICPSIPEIISSNSAIQNSLDENVPKLVSGTTQNDIRTKESSAVNVSPINLDDIEELNSSAALNSSQHATTIKNPAADRPSIPEKIGESAPKMTKTRCRRRKPKNTESFSKIVADIFEVPEPEIKPKKVMRQRRPIEIAERITSSDVQDCAKQQLNKQLLPQINVSNRQSPCLEEAERPPVRMLKQPVNTRCSFQKPSAQVAQNQLNAARPQMKTQQEIELEKVLLDPCAWPNMLNPPHRRQKACNFRQRESLNPEITGLVPSDNLDCRNRMVGRVQAIDQREDMSGAGDIEDRKKIVEQLEHFDFDTSASRKH